MPARAYRGRDPVARWGGDRPPCIFFPRDLIANLKKKIHLGPVALWGATEGIFEIFQNGHIFLKF